MASPAAAASVISLVITAPWVDVSSIKGWPASGLLRMLARRYHEERCQKRLAAASASSWVASRRSAVAAHGGASMSLGKSARIEARLNASVFGQRAFEPNPRASRW
jgi:hypothetical protein